MRIPSTENQLRELEQIRQAQSRRLIISGTAARVATSHTALRPANLVVAPTTEDMTVKVHRLRPKDIAGTVYRMQESRSPQDKLSARQLAGFPQSSLVYVHYDHSQTQSTYYKEQSIPVGVSLKEDQPIVPLEGIEPIDMARIQGCVDELEEARKLGRLPCLAANLVRIEAPAGQ